MKTDAEYRADYLENYNMLLHKNELWRLKHSLGDFMLEIAKIRAKGIRDRKEGYHNEYAISSNERGAVSLLLQNKVTIKEAKAQVERNRILSEQYFAEEAPAMQKQVAQYTPPLLSNEIRVIISALWRKQITEAHLQKDTLEFLLATDAYKSYLKRKRD